MFIFYYFHYWCICYKITIGRYNEKRTGRKGDNQGQAGNKKKIKALCGKGRFDNRASFGDDNLRVF